MSTISIEWLYDHFDCDDCGLSYAEGARVMVDGELALDLQPRAHCYGGEHYDESAVYRRILEHLGHTVAA